jgi:hypothetical protein
MDPDHVAIAPKAFKIDDCAKVAAAPKNLPALK